MEYLHLARHAGSGDCFQMMFKGESQQTAGQPGQFAIEQLRMARRVLMQPQLSTGSALFSALSSQNRETSATAKSAIRALLLSRRMAIERLRRAAGDVTALAQPADQRRACRQRQQRRDEFRVSDPLPLGVAHQTRYRAGERKAAFFLGGETQR